MNLISGGCLVRYDIEGLSSVFGHRRVNQCVLNIGGLSNMF